MPTPKDAEIITNLSADISNEVGNADERELDSISSTFNKALSDALKSFNSTAFDDDGFIRKFRDIELSEKQDENLIKNILNNIRADYISADSINQSEILLRRDIYNICTQMPEMNDVITTVRDAIIECNVSTGEVSRSISFEDHDDYEKYETQVKEIEKRYNILIAIKNSIVPKTLMNGETYIQVVPYAKLFAEIEQLSELKNGKGGLHTADASYKESSLMSDENLRFLTEAAANILKVDTQDINKIDVAGEKAPSTSKEILAQKSLTGILENISVYNGADALLAELGEDGYKDLVLREFAEAKRQSEPGLSHFEEALNANKVTGGLFAGVDQDGIDFSSYANIKGCYIKYLDSLRMIPIRIDRKIIGYYYVTTTMDLQTNAANPNGIVDLSYQMYTRDRNIVDRLSNIIIQSFDKKMIEKNIKLKTEIAEIIMAHKFSEGKLQFIYIPETEIVRMVINEDEEGRGHSILEPSLFPARMYLMLTLYNMLYTLNNNTTRVHYLKSSGLNKDYASQIQRTMRKFQQRRITIDDIYSYSGVLNKIGGMGEMVLPAGRNDYKALETDTIEAVPNPINTEFLEQLRRQAISGTGVPNLLVIQALDEVDFAKTLEMANARFLSTVSAYKIDFNNGLTALYRKIMKYSFDVEQDVLQSLHFQFNTIRQQELVITSDMTQNFNTLVELVENMRYSKAELEDKDGNPTPRRIKLRMELAKKYLPQLDFDDLEKIFDRVEIDSNKETIDNRSKSEINSDDLKQVEGT